MTTRDVRVNYDEHINFPVSSSHQDESHVATRRRRRRNNNGPPERRGRGRGRGRGRILIQEPIISRATENSGEACMLCASGGDTICCGKCHSTFHPRCMAMKDAPKEEWLCNYCVCVYCNIASRNADSCKQCDKKYHFECLLEENISVLGMASPFCSSTCAKIYKNLQSLVGAKNELDNGFFWTLLHQESLEDVHKIEECSCKICAACTIMEECYLPNIDKHTKIDVLRRMLYNCGSESMRMDFRRFYTVVLENDENIVSVATIRVHGDDIAEMPFIDATRPKYRHQEMFQKLISVIESILCGFGVKTLVIPSIPEMVETWTNQYNFSHIEDGLMEVLADYNTWMFPGAIRVSKSMLAKPSNEVLMETRGAGNKASPLLVDDVKVDKEDIPNDQNNKTQKFLPFDLNLEPPNEDDQ